MTPNNARTARPDRLSPKPISLRTSARDELSVVPRLRTIDAMEPRLARNYGTQGSLLHCMNQEVALTGKSLYLHRRSVLEVPRSTWAFGERTVEPNLPPGSVAASGLVVRGNEAHDSIDRFLLGLVVAMRAEGTARVYRHVRPG